MQALPFGYEPFPDKGLRILLSGMDNAATDEKLQYRHLRTQNGIWT